MMKKSLIIGLVAGVVGALVNVVLSTWMGICGPLWAAVVGGVAGYLAGRAVGLAPRRAAGEAGALSGGIAGALILVGQLIAAIAAVAFMTTVNPGARVFGGYIPDPATATPAEWIGLGIGALGTGLCFGLIDLVLATALGAGAGYAARAMAPETTSP